jgi:hypothetical protein
LLCRLNQLLLPLRLLERFSLFSFALFIFQPLAGKSHFRFDSLTLLLLSSLFLLFYLLLLFFSNPGRF